MTVPTIQSFDDFAKETAAMLAPPPFKSRFGAVRAKDLFRPTKPHQWLIKNVLVRGELSALAGASGCGKSFLAVDMAYCIARGVPFFGHQTVLGGVIYQVGEGASGMQCKRIPAYYRYHGIPEESDIPFVLLPSKIDLHSGDDHTNALIEECLYWGSTFPVKLELIVIDTFSAATPGANENASQDVSRVLDRCARLGTATEAAVMLAHHLDASGTKVRGHTSIRANLDSVLIAEKLTLKDGTARTDQDGRPLRRITLAKLKDGEDGSKIDFVLKGVQLGRDESGDVVTSCVAVPPAGSIDADIPAAKSGTILPDDARLVLMALDRALDEHGEAPPRELGLPSSIKRVVRGQAWRDAYASMAPDTDDEESRTVAIRKWGNRLLTRHIIGRVNPWVWRIKSERQEEPKLPPPIPPTFSPSPQQEPDLSSESFDDLIEF